MKTIIDIRATLTIDHKPNTVIKDVLKLWEEEASRTLTDEVGLSVADVTVGVSRATDTVSGHSFR